MATTDYIGDIIVLEIYSFLLTPVQIMYARFMNQPTQRSTTKPRARGVGLGHRTNNFDT
jgi:hypothetical protein